ncbi:MAG: hypothetical protein K6G80_00495 [Treponema sp.]|nr:hypothetical protein [Treponema sp.]
MKKAALFFTALISLTLLCNAQAARKLSDEEAPWRMLEKAQVAFDSGDYGMALNLANKAKENRSLQIHWELNVLENALAPRQVRRAGERFQDVLLVLGERDENDAIALIKRYLTRYGGEFYKDSVSNLVQWLNESIVYPEADFLTGRIYQLEGEFQLASSFYEKARTESDFLDIPDVKYDILYAMADLALQQGNTEEYEQMLLLVLASDPNYQNKSLVRSFEKIVDADTAENADRFFTLFRCQGKHSVSALYHLCQLKRQQNDAKGVFTCASLGMMESFTHMLESLQERDSEFKFTTLSAFFKKLSDYPEFLDWAEEEHVWELFFLFAKQADERGRHAFSQRLYQIMSDSLPSEYWRAQADNRLD